MKIFWHSRTPQTAMFEFERINTLKLDHQWVDAYSHRPQKGDVLLTYNGKNWRQGEFFKSAIYFSPYHSLKKEYDSFDSNPLWDLRFVYHAELNKYPKTALFKIPGYWDFDGKFTHAGRRDRSQFVMVSGYTPSPEDIDDIGYLRHRFIQELNGNNFLYWGSGWDPRDHHYQGDWCPPVQDKQLYSQKLWACGEFGIVVDSYKWEGYHSSDIWNCMLSGTLPIYYGHESIKDEVDPQFLIYGPDFGSVEKTIEYCKKMSPKEYNMRIDCMRAFVHDEVQHSWEHNLRHITDVLSAQFAK